MYILVRKTRSLIKAYTIFIVTLDLDYFICRLVTNEKFVCSKLFSLI